MPKANITEERLRLWLGWAVEAEEDFKALHGSFPKSKGGWVEQTFWEIDITLDQIQTVKKSLQTRLAEEGHP